MPTNEFLPFATAGGAGNANGGAGSVGRTSFKW